MRQIPGQMDIFDFIDKPEIKDQWELPCDTCGHDIKGCCDYDYIKNHDYCVLGDKWIPKRIPPIHRYLRYGPHTLISEVREETKAYLDKYGVPDWVTWDKKSLPCPNCTWWDGTTCRSGGHTNHYEYGYLICDGFFQSIVERKPSTVGESFPSGIHQDSIVYALDIRGICDDPYCPQCGYPFETTRSCARYEVDCERCPVCHVRVDWASWHQRNDKEESNEDP